MKAIIIEDETLVAKDLRNLLKQIAPELEIVTTLDSVKTCVEYFKSNPEPELLFMDIQLSDGVSFDIFNHVRINCPIIFTTAYNEYAIRAFKVNSIDYLLKPIDKTELSLALEKFSKSKSVSSDAIKDQIKSLMNHLTIPAQNKIYKERFAANSGKTHLVINQNNIACFQKDSLIYILTTDNEQFITDFQTMEEIEELLDPALFFRANRQFIININSVESYRTDSYGKLIAKIKSPNSISIDISREKAQAFKSWLH
jgi:two-component system, LytTR family, response regulator